MTTGLVGSQAQKFRYIRVRLFGCTKVSKYHFIALHFMQNPTKVQKQPTIWQLRYH